MGFERRDRAGHRRVLPERFGSVGNAAALRAIRFRTTIAVWRAHPFFRFARAARSAHRRGVPRVWPASTHVMDVNRLTTSVASPGATESTPAARGGAGGAVPTSGAAETTSTRWSGPGRLMSKLSRLRDASPEQFTQVVSSLVADLRAAAARDTGMSAKMLTALASRLDDIAGGGAISPLEPSPGAASAAAAAPDAPLPGAERSAAQAASATATNAYRSNASFSPGSDAAQAALAQMLDDLDAALKATRASER